MEKRTGRGREGEEEEGRDTATEFRDVLVVVVLVVVVIPVGGRYATGPKSVAPLVLGTIFVI